MKKLVAEQRFLATGSEFDDLFNVPLNGNGYMCYFYINHNRDLELMIFKMKSINLTNFT